VHASRFLGVFAFTSLIAAPAAIKDAAADIGFGPYTPQPTKVIAPGLVVSVVIGEHDTAIAIGPDVQYIAFDQEVSEIRRGTTGRGAYVQSQLYIPFTSAPVHFRHSLGVLALRGNDRRFGDRCNTGPFGESLCQGGTAAFTSFRFGGAYRHAAGERVATWGPQAEPAVGAGEGMFAWIGFRFTAPFSELVSDAFARSQKKSHGWETAISLGLSLPFTAGGWDYGAVSGRPLRVEEGRVVANVARGDGWSEPPSEPSPDSTRSTRWTRDALDEHASIGAFARLSLQLLGVGAPSALLRRTHEAALDEIKHAELCFSLASKFTGVPLSAGPIPLPHEFRLAYDLSTIAVEALLDGAVNEALSAAEARARLRLTEDADERSALRIIARDEGEHARLAEAIVAWCVDTGGPSVVTALLRALERIELVPTPSNLDPRAAARIRRGVSTRIRGMLSNRAISHTT
jgi:hypothetical protein